MTKEIDYSSWAAKDCWSLEESAALLLQREPSESNIASLNLEELRLLDGPVGINGFFDVQFGSELEKEFAFLLARMVDAVAAGTLQVHGDELAPRDLILWAGTRDLVASHTRQLVQAVGIQELYRIDHEANAADRRSLASAVDYLSAELKHSYTTDDILDLGIRHAIGIAAYLEGSGFWGTVRYVQSLDLEKFKSYAPSTSVNLMFGLLYLEDALVGEKHFRYGLSPTHTSEGTKKVLMDQLFVTHKDLERYVELVGTRPDDNSRIDQQRAPLEQVQTDGELAVFHPMEGLKFAEITIRIDPDNFTLRLSARGKNSAVPFRLLGLNRKNEVTLNRQGMVFLEMARGTFDIESKGARRAVSRLSQSLRSAFGTTDHPFVGSTPQFRLPIPKDKDAKRRAVRRTQPYNDNIRHENDNSADWLRNNDPEYDPDDETYVDDP